MPFTRRFEGSPYAVTKDTSSPARDFAIRIDAILGATVLTSTTCRLFTAAGQLDVTATALEVLAVIDPAPATPIATTPPLTTDPTSGKLRIAPTGGAIAFEQNSTRGRWLVIHTVSGNEVNYFYANDATNPEIQQWPYLQRRA